MANRRAMFTGECQGCGARKLVNPSGGGIRAHVAPDSRGYLTECPGTGKAPKPGTQRARPRPRKRRRTGA